MINPALPGLVSAFQQPDYNARDKFNGKPNNLLGLESSRPGETKNAKSKPGFAGLSHGALNDIKNMSANTVNARKAAALQRIEMLKQRIEGLQRLAGAIKVSPQEIARLARELKSAVAQYRNAGEGGGAPAAQPAMAGAPASQVDTGEAGAEAAVADTVEASVAAGVDAGMADTGQSAVAANVAAVDESVQQVEEVPVDDANASVGADPAVAAQPGHAANPDEQQQADKTSHSLSGLAQKLSAYQKNDPDADFRAKVKLLMEKIKALMQQAKAQDKAEQEEIKKAKKDLEDVEKAISESQKIAATGDMTALKEVVAELAGGAAEGESVASMSAGSALYDASGANSSLAVSFNISVSA